MSVQKECNSQFRLGNVFFLFLTWKITISFAILSKIEGADVFRTSFLKAILSAVRKIDKKTCEFDQVPVHFTRRCCHMCACAAVLCECVWRGGVWCCRCRSWVRACAWYVVRASVSVSAFVCLYVPRAYVRGCSVCV